jgi:tetratricopeptide (TPR) repeat protein
MRLAVLLDPASPSAHATPGSTFAPLERDLTQGGYRVLAGATFGDVREELERVARLPGAIEALVCFVALRAADDGAGVGQTGEDGASDAPYDGEPREGVASREDDLEGESGAEGDRVEGTDDADDAGRADRESVEADEADGTDESGERGDDVDGDGDGAGEGDASDGFDDGSEFPELEALAAMLVSAPPRATLVVAEVHEPRADEDPFAAAEAVERVIQALDGRARGLGVFAAAHRSSEPDARPVLELVGNAMEALAGAAAERARAVQVAELFAFLKQHPQLEDVAAGYAFVPPRSDFDLLPRGRAPLTTEPPPRSLKLREATALEPLLREAEDALVQRDQERALGAYKKALMLVPPDDKAARASILASVGSIKRSQKKLREAESNFEKAIAEDPHHKRSLRALVELAREAGEASRMVRFLRRLADAETARAKIDALVLLAHTLAGPLGERDKALAVLEEAREVDPLDPLVLSDLRKAYEAQGKWELAESTLGALVDATTSELEKAQLRYTQAEIAMARLSDEARAMTLLEQAMAHDPGHERARRALTGLRTKRGEVRALEPVLVGAIEKLASRSDVARAQAICLELAAARRTSGDWMGVVDALAGALRCYPEHVDTRLSLAEACVVAGAEDEAIDVLDGTTTIAPEDARAYHKLAALYARRRDPRRASFAAAVLDELGEADVDEQLLADQYRATEPVRATRALDDEGWALLRAPGFDPAIAKVFEAIAGAAIRVRLGDVGRPSSLDPSRKQSASSTATAVRTFAWAAQLLGIAMPDLYVLDDVPTGIAAVPTAEPTTALGPSVLSGLSRVELAFEAGRHLTYFRPEHLVLVYYPRVEDLSALFVAAAALGLEEPPSSRAKERGGRSLREALGAALDDQARASLRVAVRDLEAKGGTADLAAWVQSVERTAGRAGLLLAGDLRVALARLHGETRDVAGLTREQRRRDLLAFHPSRLHELLRGRLGVG